MTVNQQLHNSATHQPGRDPACPFCRVPHKVTVPTVHLNGTSAKDLLNDLQAAFDAVCHAQERLVAASPNGRDYYVQDAGAIERVQAQHQLRLENLQAVKVELQEMLDHVQAVVDFQADQRAARQEAR